jgi:hypothetical protein
MEKYPSLYALDYWLEYTYFIEIGQAKTRKEASGRGIPGPRERSPLFLFRSFIILRKYFVSKPLKSLLFKGGMGCIM